MERLEELIKSLRGASEEQRAVVRKEMLTLFTGKEGPDARDAAVSLMRSEVLEIQWEIEEVLELAAPPEPEPEAEPEPEPEPEPEAKKQLSASDLDMVYEDPRGLALHKTKVGNRWFATQVDPRTGQPATFELHPDEVDSIKAKLAGSPYWSLGQAPLQ